MTTGKLQPPRAYERYLERLASSTDDREDIPVRAGVGSDLAGEVVGRLHAILNDLVALSHSIHAHPEVGFNEHHAVSAAVETVQRHGNEIELGAFGLETSFRARVGANRPRVAIIAEYDALPGIGHGCGHNIICASAVGAFLAVSQFIGGVDGSVELIGAPAEEGGGGKELIARQGGFDDIDCAMMVHPAGSPSAARSYLGMRQVDVRFRGIEAHASAVPFMGRNALDACVAAYGMVAQLRQHMLPTDRIHGVISEGGDRANIVPHHASASYYVRSAEIETLVELTERLDDVFAAAALGTGTTAQVNWDPNPLILPVRNNMTLATRFARWLSRSGPAMPLGSRTAAGSTDMGNVSVRVPSIHPRIGLGAPNVPGHSAEFSALAVSERGDAAILDGAFGLAMTALDYLADDLLRDDVAREFDAQGGAIDVVGLDRRTK